MTTTKRRRLTLDTIVKQSFPTPQEFNPFNILEMVNVSYTNAFESNDTDWKKANTRIHIS